MAKTVTLKTIAEHLNISPSLVCRALNDKYGVSEEMRELVKNTARQLNYISRVSSPSDKAKKVVLLLLDIALSDIFKDHGIYNYILIALTQRLEQEGIRLEPIFIQNYSLVELSTLIESKQPCGIVSISDIDASYVKKIFDFAIPFVMIDAYHYEDIPVDLVRTNNFAIGYRSAKHLIKLGHRNLAFVGNTCYSMSFQNRFDGFLYCIKNCEVPGIRWKCAEDNTPKHFLCSKEALKNLLESADRPSGIVCGNDYVALQIYEQAKALNIHIPHELSIIGCDNYEKKNFPKFASFDLRPSTMGTYSAELLLKRMANPAQPALYLQIDPEFIKGETVAPFAE